MELQNYKELIVWQKSIDLVEAVYKITENFPKNESFGLTSQMRRAAISVASNIAEGRNRGTRKDFVQFLRMALGSASELETQIIICKRIPPLSKYDYQLLENLLTEIIKMLNSMIKKLKVES